MMHETLMRPASCFLTLTYDEESVPDDGNLVRDHFTNFHKRLRHELVFSFFHCGEYGGQTGRPHYHAMLFGSEFNGSRWARSFYGYGKKGHALYESKTLNEIWGHGSVRIGEASFESAAYVARYVTKALPSNQLPGYKGWSLDQARIQALKTPDRTPEYATMSRRPALGRSFFEAHWRQIYARDEVVVEGRVMRPPRYYDRLLEKRDPDLYERIKKARSESARAEFDRERMLARWKARHLITKQARRDGLKGS